MLLVFESTPKDSHIIEMEKCQRRTHYSGTRKHYENAINEQLYHRDRKNTCNKYRMISASRDTYSVVSRAVINNFHHFFVKFSLLLVCLSLCGCVSATGKSCDPTDPSSCGFGAVCEIEDPHYNYRSVIPATYVCKCPQLNCYRAGLYEPVCGVRGKQKTYFNILCLMLEECERQRPIKQICYGKCGKSCKTITEENRQNERCKADMTDFCFNGGLCLYHKTLEEPYCKCPDEYEGTRCEYKVLPRPDETSSPSKCSSTPKALAIFALVLLGLLLLLFVACFCWRKSKRDGEKGSDLWSDNGETTPLRDSGRSEFIYPRQEQSGTDSN